MSENRPLTTYLRTYRKRSGFSQEEVAFLLGGYHRSRVSRHERGTRAPRIENAFMYEIVVGIPMKDLYAGLYHRIERDVRKRAVLLRKSLEKAPRSGLRDKKIRILDSIIGGDNAPSA